MKILLIGGSLYCKTGKGFSYEKLSSALETKLNMRRGSFAERWSRKIFQILFQNAIDLKLRYEKYYAEEYESFEVFLYQKDLWEKQDIQELGLANNQTLLALMPEWSSYNIATVIENDDELLNIINRTLEGVAL